MKAKTKLAKLCSILLVLVMVVGMLPTVALAAGPATATADFTSGDGSVALALLNTAKTEDAADSKWDSDTNTLTLNGVNFETTAAIAVKLPADSQIVLNGDNTIKGGDSNSSSCYGIYAEGSLTISDSDSGSDTLNVTGGNADYESYGIYATDGLTISGDAYVNATGGTVNESNGFISGFSYGIYAGSTLTISDDADVTANGGKARTSFGIRLQGSKIAIEGGTVNAVGGQAKAYSYGISASSVAISGGTVTATGGTATEHKSYGISASSVTISGGTFTAKANTSALSKAPSELPGAYQWRTSESGTYTASSNNGYAWDSAHTYVEIRDTAPAAATTYTVTVTNGTASVSKAAAGTTVTLAANTAPSGQVFDKWVVESGSASISLADATNANTTFTMPAGNVSVKATYKAAPHTHSYGSNWETDASKHWHKCSCGDKSAEAVHTAGDWIIDTAATATTVGTKHKECTTCGYVMETGTIPATGSVTAPQIIEGDGAKVTNGKKAALSFRSDADFSDFIRVEIDGKTLDAKNYTVKKGSTIVTLNADYVSTLSVGTHTIGIVSYSGTATATFTVEAKQTTGGEYNPNTGAQDDVSQTGDNSMMALWIAVLFVPAAGVLGTAVFGKKKQNQAE